MNVTVKGSKTEGKGVFAGQDFKRGEVVLDWSDSPILTPKQAEKIPEEDKQSFEILQDEEIISRELSERLQDAKGMRNILSHQYGKVDDKIVFESLKEQLIRNIEEFIQQIKKFLKG